MEIKQAKKNGYTDLASEIPDLTFRRSDSISEAVTSRNPISRFSPVAGLPKRTTAPEKTYQWGPYDIEYFKNPLQEKPHCEPLEYTDALYVFRNQNPLSSDPLFCCAIFKDPDTDIPCLVLFDSETALFDKSYEKLLKEEERINAMFAVLARELNLEEEPQTSGNNYRPHPFSGARNPIGAFHKERKIKEGTSYTFWMAIAIAGLIFAAAFIFSAQ